MERDGVLPRRCDAEAQQRLMQSRFGAPGQRPPREFINSGQFSHFYV